MKISIASVFLAFASTVAGESAYWAVYPDGDARDSCSSAGPGESVDISCCTNAPSKTTIVTADGINCASMEGKGTSIDDGFGNTFYKDCAAGASVYGELCSTLTSDNVEDAEECGCTLTIIGDGCRRIYDNTRESIAAEFFVYLDNDSDCGTGGGSSSSSSGGGSEEPVRAEESALESSLTVVASGAMDMDGLKEKLESIEMKLDMLISDKCPGSTAESKAAPYDP